MSITDATRRDLAALAKVRVFFSHHSVGANVLDGIGALAREAGCELVVASASATQPVSGPAILEDRGGSNGDPDSKIAFFESKLKQIEGEPEVALMKLCYVDFNPHVDSKALFSRYRSALKGLKERHPRVTFVHVTAPLTARPTGLKNSISRLLGREIWEQASNAKRFAFNHCLLSEFEGEPIFDIARFESMQPDGRQETVTHGGQKYPALYPGYTDDGGHLNAKGQRVLAAEFARVITAAARVRS